MKLGNTLNSIQHVAAEDRTEADIYITPASLARELISRTPVLAGQTILDPAKGTGAFFDNFPEGHWIDFAEISEGKDFFSEQRKFDWIITNPPFSKLKKWLQKSCTTAEVGFAYILPLHGLTEHRVRACADLGFNITSLTLFKNPTEWGLGFQMAWVVWEKTPAGSGLSETDAGLIQQSLFDY